MQAAGGATRRPRGGRGRGRGDQAQAPAAQVASTSTPVAQAAVPAATEVVSPVASPILSPKASGAVVAGSHLTTRRFTEFAKDISPASLKCLKESFGYETMTVVQTETIPAIASGQDVLARARTGTGKTLAFLLPTITRATKNPPPASGIYALVLAPTRELAMQIFRDAERLLEYHGNGHRAGLVFGGVSIKKDATFVSGAPVTILVATPGRIVDHLQNTKGFAARLAGVKVFILDECDQLLDMGFKPALMKISAALPPRTARQSLLFSATVPASVAEIARNSLREGHSFVDTVGSDAPSGSTHDHLDQSVIVAPFGPDMLRGFFTTIANEVAADKEHKIIVFAGTARVAGFLAAVWRYAAGPAGTFEIHSRLSQPQRTRESDAFRAAACGVLFSSDVSARGVDYPDVTAVFMLGMTSKEQYIHRVGRTARAGRRGKSMLVLADFEARHVLRAMQELPIEKQESFPAAAAGAAPTMRKVAAVLANANVEPAVRTAAEKAYVAWLGFYNTEQRKLGWGPEDLIAKAGEWASFCGLSSPPAVEAKTIGVMGLKAYRHLFNVAAPGARQQQQQGGRGQQQGGRGQQQQQGGRGQPQQQQQRQQQPQAAAPAPARAPAQAPAASPGAQKRARGGAGPAPQAASPAQPSTATGDAKRRRRGGRGGQAAAPQA